MTLKMYKEIKGLSNKALTEELKVVQPGLDEPLVSRMVNGVVRPSQAVEDYVAEMLEKAIAIGSGASLQQIGIVYRPEGLTPLESQIFERASNATRYDPVSRRELVYLTNACDRVVRECIESIRRKGGRICSGSGRKGYWVARTDAEYLEFRREYISRIRSLAGTLKAMDEVVEGQISWGEAR